jgi:hypothetical protein
MCCARSNWSCHNILSQAICTVVRPTQSHVYKHTRCL